MNTISTNDYDIDNKGKIDVTAILQELIDSASKNGDQLIIASGIYLVSNLYLRNNSNIILSEDSVILGLTDESKYDIIPTRVAGIEMDWFPAIINIIDAQDVVVSGNGTICGAGEYFYNKYWGKDMRGGMRKEYDAIGLRWACDYDCKRVRNVLVSNSSNVLLSDFTSKDSGFWNVHILYSKDIIVDGIRIESGCLHGPSTDGIDIDSCHDVVVKNVIANCNDDSICIKSGRDYDGLRVNKPCYNIEIKDCKILKGFGITIGSEVTAGVYNVNIKNISYEGTDCGFRIKSSIARKGYIKDITVDGMNCVNVKYLFHMYLNWNPLYSICSIPESYSGEIPSHWRTMCKEIKNTPNTLVSNIVIRNVNSTYTDDYLGISRVFNLEGYEEQPISNISFENLNVKAKEYGVINFVKNIKINNANISCSNKHDINNDVYDNR